VDPCVNKDRLWQSHMDLAKIGTTPKGGVCRLALSDEDRDARDLFVSWCKAEGLAVRIDGIGNIFARRAGTDPDASPVLTGSHLDTQPLGGNFDGIYGVLAGLEMMRALNEADAVTRAPIDLVVWTNEEGARFDGGCMGSSVFAGEMTLADALAVRDRDGISVGEELQRIGYAGSEPCARFPIDALFEVHIEQGPVLGSEGRTIGVVQGGQGICCYNVHVRGEEGHAGTLPMDKRKDAFQGAARMAVAIDVLASTFRPSAVITVGVVNVGPGSRNTIPGSTSFSIDCRCPDETALEHLEQELRSICKSVANERGLGLGFDVVSRVPPVTFDEGCINLVRGAAARLQISHQDIYSGAGHDACHISGIASVGMIFVPCKDGISHNELESATPEDLAQGCRVLLDAVRTRAG